MADQDAGPLTEQDFIAIKEQLSNLDKADLEISRAKRAGIDIADAEERSKEARKRLMQLKQVYFPTRV